MFRFYSLLIVALAAPMSAQAIVQETASWSFKYNNNCISGTNDSCNTYTSGGYDFGNSQNFKAASGSGNVLVSAYSTTKDMTDGSDQFETGTLSSWDGGLGVTSNEDGSFGAQPHHAFDNDGGTGTNTSTPDEGPGGDVDAAVFKFEQDISLTDISIGWKNTGCTTECDADISVLAYKGAGTPAVVNGTYADLIKNGWVFINNYANLAVGVKQTISTAVTSSYWLVSAYTKCAKAALNQSKGIYECSTANETNLDFGNDYFKISSLSGAYKGPDTSVPEPASILLLCSGVLSWRLNRGKQSLTVATTTAA